MNLSRMFLCSHSLIGEFETTLNKLTTGPGKQNEYVVSNMITWEVLWCTNLLHLWCCGVVSRKKGIPHVISKQLSHDTL